MNNTLVCPFCAEGDFDAVGLKNHLLMNYCYLFNTMMSVEQERLYNEQRKRKSTTKTTNTPGRI